MGFPTPLRAIVTGAGSGLGRALSLELAGRGASLIVSDIDLEAARGTADLLRKTGATVHAVACDVTDRHAVFGLVDEAEERLGGIDLIANNAGVSVGGAFNEISIEDWRWVVDINMWGVIHGCQAVIPKMKSQGRGYVLNIASAAGLLVPPENSPYCVTKAAVVTLSESLYTEYKGDGIRVTALCPGYFRTNIVESRRGVDSRERDKQVIGWMERSKIQAAEVAKAGIDAVEAGTLYAQPMGYTRMAWRLKRSAPQRFYDIMGLLHRRDRQPK
jgi:NAD(P)-dependent dehydrogenase (short-subunit alcohol dehydrogenase family)